jgi:hypothetical protein
MIDRRQMLTVSGLLSALAPAGEEAAYGAGQMSDRSAADVINGLQKIGNALAAVAAQGSFDAILPLRNRQVEYLKANGKFPDFIDVGADVWMSVYDWHVRLQQPLTLGRDSTGRYTMLLGYTALVLRPDVLSNFISTPYDNR